MLNFEFGESFMFTTVQNFSPIKDEALVKFKIQKCFIQN